MKTIFVKASSLCLALVGLPILAHGKDSFRIEYFAIRGTTAQQLRADLSRLGPVGETGIRGDGYTEYRIAWKFTMTLNDGVCRASDANVDLDVIMRLPRWNPPAGVPKRLVDTWERFSQVLREHEDEHHRLAIAAAREVQRELRARKRAPTCEALKIRLNATANKVLARYREKQLAYDLDTDYGRAQGTGLL
jgi:predicted secreted Zn-dependent protease